MLRIACALALSTAQLSTSTPTLPIPASLRRYVHGGASYFPEPVRTKQLDRPHSDDNDIDGIEGDATQWGDGDQPPMYENNGGTVLALAGDTYACVAADTRLSKGYSILSRKVSRLWEVAPGVWLGAGGCHSDCMAVADALRLAAAQYTESQASDRSEDEGSRPSLSCEEAARCLSALLYQRRSMPYYAFCVLAGVDKHGRGAVQSPSPFILLKRPVF
jgi:20S proteasome subunit beta 6